MKVSADSLSGRSVVLNIEADPEDVEKSLEKAYRRLVNKTNIPGFRKGKAPRPILERFMGKEALLQDALRELKPELYQRAIQEQNLDAIGSPEIEMVTTNPVVFKATVSLRPIVELGDFRQLRFSPEAVVVSDSEVDNAMEGLRAVYARLEPVERAVALDDMLTIDIEGKAGETLLIDKKNIQYRVRAGSSDPAPGFAEKLVGLEKGVGTEFSIIPPPDYSESELAGKECHFKVRIIEIKESRLPELNDDFAKGLGENVETLQDLRQRLFSNIKVRAEQEARRRLEDKIVEGIIKISRMEFPEALVEEEVHGLIDEQCRRSGDNLEDYLKSINKTEEQLHEELHPVAEERIRRSLVLGKVAEVDGIKIEESEIETEIERMVGNAGQSPDKVRQALRSPMARRSVEMILLTRKTLDHLIKIVTQGETPAAAGAEPEAQPQ